MFFQCTVNLFFYESYYSLSFVVLGPAADFSSSLFLYHGHSENIEKKKVKPISVVIHFPTALLPVVIVSTYFHILHHIL